MYANYLCGAVPTRSSDIHLVMHSLLTVTVKFLNHPFENNSIAQRDLYNSASSSASKIRTCIPYRRQTLQAVRDHVLSHS